MTGVHPERRIRVRRERHVRPPWHPPGARQSCRMCIDHQAPMLHGQPKWPCRSAPAFGGTLAKRGHALNVVRGRCRTTCWLAAGPTTPTHSREPVARQQNVAWCSLDATPERRRVSYRKLRFGFAVAYLVPGCGPTRPITAPAVAGRREPRVMASPNRHAVAIALEARRLIVTESGRPVGRRTPDSAWQRTMQQALRKRRC